MRASHSWVGQQESKVKDEPMNALKLKEAIGDGSIWEDMGSLSSLSEPLVTLVGWYMFVCVCAFC